MSKQVAIKQQTAVSTEVVDMAKAMADIGIEASDLVVPRLMLMQNTSEMVGDEKAKLGDIVNSQTLEVLGGITSPLEIIPLKMTKTYRIYDMTDTQPKFIRQEPVTSANVNLPWEDVEDGITIRRYLCMNFFVLIKKEVESGEAFPVVITFKSTSLNAGKQLATHLFKMVTLGWKPYSRSMLLKVNKQKKDTNVWAVFEIARGNELVEEHVAKAAEWLNNVNSMTVKVVGEEEEVTAPQSSATPVVVGKSDGDLKI